ncbi:MAG TPA: hypothetical protein PKE51_00020 [Gemmatimonadaceae bacterium]|nr:hypothetical protein [Gemmatimonadaceae bacterium]
MPQRPPRPRRPIEVLVVAHTHWDREWYHTAPRFRQRLAALVASLLADPPSPTRPFLLDGQAVVLEDVVALRPDLREPLVAAVRTGAIEAGPWYVLADELLPSGEALIRNLLAGRRFVRAFGAEPPPVCYSPDAFGHPAALPALAAGFGLTVGIVWRGYGGAAWPAGDTLRWVAPDGSVLLTWHLPPDGYEYGSALPVEPDAAARRWAAMRKVVAPRSRTGVVLCTNGADHHALQPDLDVALAALAAAARRTGDTVERTTLRAWAERFAEAATRARRVPTVQGELRDSTGYTWSLQGTFATRAHQKRAVARADRLLRHDVEPWVALAAHLARQRAAAPPRDGRVDPMVLPTWLQRTWTTFLRVLPHDTLCGCSVDEVARALEHRLDVVHADATGLREAALDVLLRRDAVHARARDRATWQTRLVLRNGLARPRAGLAEVTLTRTLGDVAVGPGSGGRHLGPTDDVVPWPKGWVGQVLGVRRTHRRRESPQHYPDNDLVEETRALVWVPPDASVPGTGLRVVDPSAPPPERSWPPRDPTLLLFDSATRARVPDRPSAVQVVRRGSTALIENCWLRLEVRPRGLTLVDLFTGAVLPDWLGVVWQADHGDSYTPAPRGAERALRAVRARIVQQGPLRVAVRVTFARDVPEATAPDERDDGVPRAARRRRTRTRRVVVDVTCTVDAEAAHVGLHVRGHDPARDHALRLVVRTGLHDPRIVADAACWPVERAVGVHPMHRWLALAGPRRGVLLIGDGLAESTVRDDGRVALTLVRATGELSRAHLPERPGHAGWPARIPDAQGPGRFAARFAISPFGRFDAGRASQLADDVLLPLVGETWRDAEASAPSVVWGCALDASRDVQPLAVLPADDGDGIVLRCVNLGDESEEVCWLVPWPDAEASVVRLDETPVAQTVRVTPEVAPDGAAVSRVWLDLAPQAMSTVRVR